MRRVETPVALILDRSALHAYIRGSLGVSETLLEVVQESGARFGIPVAVLAEAVAAAELHQIPLLRELSEVDACVLLPSGPQEVWLLADWRRRLDRMDLALCARASMVHMADILTDEPERYAVKDGPPMIAIEDTFG